MSAKAKLVVAIATAASPEVALSSDGLDLWLASERGALESIAGMLERLLDDARATTGEFGLVGVCTGPGSFTGLRIGVAFARTLSQTLGVPIVGVSSYDVAAFGHESFPLVTVARGKKNYYYARVATSPHAQPTFVQGEKTVIEQAAAHVDGAKGCAQIVGSDFTEMRPGDAARAVAHLARRAHARGESTGWQQVEIDYGQRPNAVLNWERRTT